MISQWTGATAELRQSSLQTFVRGASMTLSNADVIGVRLLHSVDENDNRYARETVLDALRALVGDWLVVHAGMRLRAIYEHFARSFVREQLAQFRTKLHDIMPRPPPAALQQQQQQQQTRTAPTLVKFVSKVEEHVSELLNSGLFVDSNAIGVPPEPSCADDRAELNAPCNVVYTPPQFHCDSTWIVEQTSRDLSDTIELTFVANNTNTSGTSSTQLQAKIIDRHPAALRAALSIDRQTAQDPFALFVVQREVDAPKSIFVETASRMENEVSVFACMHSLRTH